MSSRKKTFFPALSVTATVPSVFERRMVAAEAEGAACGLTAIAPLIRNNDIKKDSARKNVLLRLRVP
jgi:hypothetical protein